VTIPVDEVLRERLADGALTAGGLGLSHCRAAHFL
jgi:hypothetical protein